MLRSQRKQKSVIQHAINAFKKFTHRIRIAPMHRDHPAGPGLGGKIPKQFLIGINPARPLAQLDLMLPPLQDDNRVPGANPVAPALDANEGRGHG